MTVNESSDKYFWGCYSLITTSGYSGCSFVEAMKSSVMSVLFLNYIMAFFPSALLTVVVWFFHSTIKKIKT